MSDTEMIPEAVQEPETESARLFTVTDVEERLRAARAEWETEHSSALEEAKAAAFADGQAEFAAAHSAEIRVLEEELHAAKRHRHAARRRSAVRGICVKYLSGRSW